MRLLTVVAASLLRQEHGARHQHASQHQQGSHLLPLIWPSIGDSVQATADGMLPSELHGAPTQVCPQTLLTDREGAWVSACFKADNRDQELAKNLRPWVNFRYSSVTKAGQAAICVAAAPCVDAIVAYTDAFENEGCKHNPAQKPGYELSKVLQRTADMCARFGDTAGEGTQDPAVNGNAAGGDLSLEGCYHDYPACAQDGGSCLEFPTVGKAGAQKLHELYYVQQTCYKAVRECMGCLYDPSGNPDALQPWNCPDTKCTDHLGQFAPADNALPAASACVASCPGWPACGHDGCGGSCGVCGEQESCNQGSCVYRPFKNRFEPRARAGVEAPPEWFEDMETDQFIDHRKQKRDDELGRKVFKDWQPAEGRQGMGRLQVGLLDRSHHPPA